MPWKMKPAPAEFKPGSCRGRFAPSPTGPLHFGSLAAAFGSFLRARAQGGQWLVRVEDIDTPRVVPGAAQLQLDTLRHFGLDWDGEVLWQSRRLEAYRDALDRLRADNRVFPCRCSRSELAAAPHRACIGTRRQGQAAWRLRVPDRDILFVDAVRGPQRQNLAQEIGDVVLWRADGLVAYQLAVVVDDAAQGITEVVRGADLLDSTARQIFLQEALGLPTPAYAHLPLALDADGYKLGKSQQALALDASRPMPALRTAWAFLGQRPGALDDAGDLPRLIDAAIAAFDLTRVPKTDHRTAAALS